MIIRSSTTPGQINFHADEVKYCTKSSKVQASGKKFMFEKKKKKVHSLSNFMEFTVVEMAPPQ